MIGFPSKVLVLADYPNPHFTDRVPGPIDFVLSCGDVDFQILQEVFELFRKPIFAVKGNHDSTQPFPSCVKDVSLKLVQHRNWLIGGLEGVPAFKSVGAYQWDDMAVTEKLDRFPYVDVFICHSPLHGITDKADYAHCGSEAILRYVREKQPQYVFHGHVHAEMGTMIGGCAVVSVFGFRVCTLAKSAGQG